ncbi:Metallo-dependent phosphatase [Mollisia scopiformis]|uniref:Metallo-dependent phosphatase n=1 Tax=Mollisia scopiformis TaxID=149040 RepID=A0A194WTK8_MOLSC|nr:Metallo-dependent phosphatase [Mollisia scopiformis]KUJ10952.1 Metallo-dependent phosphatase [Mollisia scopiformis]
MTEQQPTMRKTRFVCVSDTHNASPNGAFKLPKGDVLIHAGDMTNQGSISELRKTVKWVEEADFEAKIVIAGNHDITLDSGFYAQYGSYFHNQHPQDPAECQQLLEQSASIRWLRHESATIKLDSPTGPRTTFKIFGSPLSPENGMWAFRYRPEEAVHVWDQIPLDSDIVMTHTPPKYHCDETGQRRSAGCESLRNALWRVRPRLAICGHVHEGRGADRVRWDLRSSNLKYKEESVQRWEDPGRDNKKMSLIDLTSKGSNALDNDGSNGEIVESSPTLSTSQAPIVPVVNLQQRSSNVAISRIATNLLALPAETLPAATRGHGGCPPSLRCDLEALSGRLGRRETCIINAAIMTSSWPHGSGGGKRYNKPIVVDIDLPVWGE